MKIKRLRLTKIYCSKCKEEILPSLSEDPLITYDYEPDAEGWRTFHKKCSG